MPRPSPVLDDGVPVFDDVPKGHWTPGGCVAWLEANNRALLDQLRAVAADYYAGDDEELDRWLRTTSIPYVGTEGSSSGFRDARAIDVARVAVDDTVARALMWSLEAGMRQLGNLEEQRGIAMLKFVKHLAEALGEAPAISPMRPAREIWRSEYATITRLQRRLSDECSRLRGPLKVDLEPPDPT